MGDIAVLISGQIRTLDICYKSILETYPNADFYVQAVDDQDAYKAELLKPVRLLIEPTRDLPERPEYSFQIGRLCHGVQGCLRQWYNLLRCWQLYQNSGHKHKWIVRHRPDLLTITEPPPQSEWKEDIMVPGHDNWWGIHDWHGIMTPECAKVYFTRINVLDDYINQDGIFHPETFLEWAIRDFKVHRVRTHLNIVRADGTRMLANYRDDTNDVYCS